MSAARRAGLTGQQIEAIAWGFLHSEFTGQIYAIWPMDRRIDAYLLRRGMRAIINDGSAYNRLTERVMANMGRALRAGPVKPSGGHRDGYPQGARRPGSSAEPHRVRPLT
ncbi:hypothetical protein AFM11_20475 [Mycolicibacterium wolinskyi]|uniref:Uncharacterized protein n=1 Tax=Mycolicibacterium wolinskyi TaxID=59750 RepID=A0A132PJL6_9MYCO|nr:hypothetical protein [Mycolicibacterium wolinskyi]KWX22521.1 hypothetical protein AFM11_20475 [Mycolicibacterium wolinskyi]